MGMIKAPARVTVVTARGDGMEVEMFRNRREMVEFYIQGRRLYLDSFADDELAQWLRSIAERALAVASALATQDDGASEEMPDTEES